MEERDQLQGARRSAVGDYLEQQQQQDGVYLIHSQVMRIKKEEEEARELLLKLQLLETRPAGGGRCPATTLRASRSLSPLRRAGGAIPVGEWSIDDDLFFFCEIGELVPDACPCWHAVYCDVYLHGSEL